MNCLDGAEGVRKYGEIRFGSPQDYHEAGEYSIEFGCEDGRISIEAFRLLVTVVVDSHTDSIRGFGPVSVEVSRVCMIRIEMLIEF